MRWRLADLEKRGNSPSATSLMAARDAGVATGDGARRGLLASLFRGSKDDDEEETTATVAPAPKTTKVAAIEVKQPEPVKQEVARVANVPLPQQRPARPVQVASAAPKQRCRLRKRRQPFAA